MTKKWGTSLMDVPLFHMYCKFTIPKAWHPKKVKSRNEWLCRISERNITKYLYVCQNMSVPRRSQLCAYVAQLPFWIFAPKLCKQKSVKWNQETTKNTFIKIVTSRLLQLWFDCLGPLTFFGPSFFPLSRLKLFSDEISWV